MLAVRIRQYGNRDVPALDEVPVPDAGPGAVLVKVVAAPVKPVDWKVREGWLAHVIPHPLPLGWNVPGVIAAVGSAVTGWQAGKIVLYAGTP